MKETREAGATPDLGEERFKQLLSAMETFWAQAPRQMPLLAASTPAASTPAAPATAPVEAPPISKEVPAKKPTHRWLMAVAMAAGAVALSYAIPVLQHELSRYLIVGSMPVSLPKAPAVPAPPVETVQDQPLDEPIPAAKPKPARPLRRFEGPQIALEIPSSVRAKIPAEARVQVVVAIDEQGHVTNAEVASVAGQGARLLTKEALQAARSSRFRPAREGERAVGSQMVLTYLFKPDSAEF